MIIIGITGTIGAGKGTVVDYLVKQEQFKHYSVRSFLIAEIERRNLPINRDSMTLLANELRLKHEPSYIVEQLYNQAIEQTNNCIIESIRNIGEIDCLKAKGKFYLLAVDADSKLRYERIIVRGSETDHITYETFLENEAREMQSADKFKQNLRGCINQADFLIENNGTLETLSTQIKVITDEIKRRSK